jgi:hypothetical protein
VAVTVTHTFVSPVADNSDPDEVGPDEWNAAHTVTGLGTAAEANTSDFAAAIHTHDAADVTDFDTAVSANTDVAANTAARHDPVTVTDSAEIDFTLTGQDITAELVAGSIDETKLDASVNASLDLADSALQNGAIGVSVQAYSANLDEYAAVNPTTAGLALLDDADATAQLVTLGFTATITELNYTDGVTSAIQTQLDGKQPLDADLTSWANVTRASGFDTFVATPSSANLASLVTGETGSGALVFATSPTLTTPNIGNATAGTITATGSNQVTSSGLNFIAKRESDNNAPPEFQGHKGRVGPAAVQTDDRIFALSAQGFDGTSYNATNSATMGFYAAENFTTSARGSYFKIETTAAGTISRAARMRVQLGVFHESATGGDKGNNTINFGAVYDDNTLLTCYPFDAYLDGDIDESKWDDLVPNRFVPKIEDDEGNVVEPERTELRRHEDMRKFKARLGTEYDPLDLEKYIAHWKEKRHLTSLPNEAKFDPVQNLPTGAWIQRLVETVEIQAIHIGQLHERLKALEKPKVAPK